MVCAFTNRYVEKTGVLAGIKTLFLRPQTRGAQDISKSGGSSG